MFGLPALDIAIGLSFVYLLLGLICTTVNEIIAGTRGTRAKFLDRGITRLLGDDVELKRRFYLHPAIKTLAKDDSGICPSYIPEERFATALMDILSGSDKPLTDVAAIRSGIEAVNPDLRAQVKLLIDKAGDAPDDLRKAMEGWFSDTMDRVSGWYKRNAQRNAVILAAVVTLVVNADTVSIVQRLWQNPSLRAAVVEEARNRSQRERPEDLLPVAEYANPNDPTEGTPVRVSDSELGEKEKELLRQLTGWDNDWARWGELRSAQPQRGTVALAGVWFGGLLWAHFLGWLLTTLAVSQGAPFWFDMLNRFMNIRNAGRAPDESRKKTAPAK
jgi:hypothetical protein